MQFKINSDKFSTILKKIKTVKSYEKNDESLSSLLISTTKEPKLTITAMNNAFWSSITLIDSDFSDGEVLEEDKVFVNANDFIEMILAIPKNTILEFKTQNINKAKLKGDFLSLKYKSNKKQSSLDFAISKPKFFDEEPCSEQRKTAEANPESFINAIKSVAFAFDTLSSQDVTDPFLWGSLIEIRNKNVVAIATNRKRICFYDKEKSTENPDFKFNPISSYLLPVIDVLDDTNPLFFEVGYKTTIIKQNNCTYVLPNVSEPEKFPNWKAVLDKVTSSHKAKITFSKQSLSSTLKMVGLASGNKMGVRIDLDTAKKTIGFATQIVDDGGFMKAIYEESYPLEDDQINVFEDPVMESVLLNIEFLKDVADTFDKDEDIYINFGTNNTPVIIEGSKSVHKYILTSLEIGTKK
jgi:DNA polymerase III sliding clamp (beta) subunit (PCNA family)